MFKRKPVLLLGALIGLTLPPVASAQDLASSPSRQAGSGPQLAQYFGPDAGPDGFGGPGFGYGPPPGYAGGPGYEPGYGPGRRPTRSGPVHSGRQVSYHGFHIDMSEESGSRNLAGETAAMKHQIDLVGSVGLRMSDLQLFRSLPIRIHNGLSGGGHYDGGSSVQMGNLVASDRRPVLLHEFMHVYHHSRLPGGFQNPDIRAFYEEAVSRQLYDGGSYMLSNPGEFFAMTASCYLYGSVARAPFTREEIRTRQPDYYAYLGHLFGPPHGMHSAGTAQSRLRAHGPFDYAQEPAYN